MSMNGKFIKLPSEESGGYTANNNRVHFHLPVGDYDFSRSYVTLYSRLNVNGNVAGGIYDVIPHWKNSLKSGTTKRFPELENSVMIRNAMLASGVTGRLEDIRRVDVLRQNLAPYIKSTSEINASRNLKFSSSAGEFDVVRNPFIKKIGYGNTMSSYPRVPILIPLSEIFELGSIKWSNAMGDCRMRFELNIANIEVFKQQMDFPSKIRESLEVSYTNSTGAPVDLYSITLDDALSFGLDEENPFFVGRVCNMHVEGVNVKTFITQIDLVDGKLKITFNDKLKTVPDGDTITVTFDILDKADEPTAELEVEYAEIVVFQSDAPYPMPEKKVYRTWTTEEYKLSPVANIQRQYELEPNAINVIVMPIQDDLVSNSHTLNSFRLRVNGEDVNDRDTQLGFHLAGGVREKMPTGLYYNNISQTFLNMGIPLKNMNEALYIISNEDTTVGNEVNVPLPSTLQKTFDESRLSLIATPLHITTSQKLFQLNLESTSANLEHIVLFKNVVREL